MAVENPGVPHIRYLANDDENHFAVGADALAVVCRQHLVKVVHRLEAGLVQGISPRTAVVQMAVGLEAVLQKLVNKKSILVL